MSVEAVKQDPRAFVFRCPQCNSEVEVYQLPMQPPRCVHKSYTEMERVDA